MNYLILKNIIESTILSFKCKSCNSPISEGNINILGTAGNSINMEIICPKCKTQGIAKAEIGIISNMKGPEFINNFKNLVNNNEIKKEETSIKDDDITLLRESLKTCISVKDLFKN